MTSLAPLTARTGRAIRLAAVALALLGACVVLGWFAGPAAAANAAPTPMASASAMPSASPSPMPSPGPSFSPSPSPSPSPTPVVPPPPGPLPVLGTGGSLAPGSSVTFYGRGSGTGVGMSQWGARGRALAGQDAAGILAHYYQGTTLAALDPATPVRVMVVNRLVPTATRPAKLYGRGGPWTVDGIDAVFPPDAMLLFRRVPGGWHVAVTDTTGAVLYDGAPGTDLRIRPASPDTRIQVWFKPSKYDLYRGVVRLIGYSGSVRAINEVSLDDYLLGVVPAEMPFTWPEEALKAQAVAARSYAVRHLHPTWGIFDLFDDSRHQIYLGVRAEKPSTTAAVTATAGQVLMVDGVVANTLYNPVAGGATESNQFAYVTQSGGVYVSPVPYLAGSSDRAPDGTAYDAASGYATWQSATYTVEALSAILATDPRTDVGQLIGIDLSARGVSGRLYAITLTGSTRSVTVSGDVFRAVFNRHRPIGDPILRSNLFDLAPIP